MSYVDLDKMTPEDLILHFVLECRGSGHFLPYQDYQIIEDWMKAAGDADELLVVLSDVLPGYFAGPVEAKVAEGIAPKAAGATTSKRSKSLSGVKKLVLSRLRDRAMRLAKGARGAAEKEP